MSFDHDSHGNYQTDGRRVFKLPSAIGPDGGLQCPKCGCADMRVTNSYNWEAGGRKRRRACRHCGWSITTVEVPVQE